jgi:hypothetical protein
MSATVLHASIPQMVRMVKLVMGEGSDPRKIHVVDRQEIDEEKQQPGNGTTPIGTTKGTTLLHLKDPNMRMFNITPADRRAALHSTIGKSLSMNLYYVLQLDRGALFRFCH